MSLKWSSLHHYAVSCVERVVQVCLSHEVGPKKNTDNLKAGLIFSISFLFERKQ